MPDLIRAVPTDPDRALFPYNDDCEAVTGRVIRRCGREAEVVETCLSILGDAQATRVKGIADAIGQTHGAWGGRPDPENRAAQVLSLTCRDRKYEPRIRAAFDRYRVKPVTIPRVFDTGDSGGERAADPALGVLLPGPGDGEPGRSRIGGFAGGGDGVAGGGSRRLSQSAGAGGCSSCTMI